MMPQVSPFSPSRLGQQPVQWFSHWRSMGAHGGEWNHVFQAPISSFNTQGPHSPGSNNSSPWGTLPTLPYIFLFKLFFE